MNAPDRLGNLRVNPDWAKLPLFSRKGWRTMKFGDFAESINERVEPADAADEPYVGLDDLDSGDLHIRRWGKGSDVIGTKLRFRKGDIIFGRRRAYQRKLAVAEFDGICSAHALVVRAKPSTVLPEFLPFLMMSDRFMKRAVEISVGSLSPTINWTTLKLEEFALPPLQQQGVIASVLREVHNDIANSGALLQELRRTKTATLNRFFPPNKTFTEIRRMPGRDIWTTLRTVCRRITDGVHLTPTFTESGIPFLLVANIVSGAVDWKVERWISSQTYEELTRNKKAEKGDVLYTIVASYGVPVLIDWDRPFAFQRHIALIQPDQSKLLGRYLVLFLESYLGRRQADVYAEGNAQRTISLGSLSQFSIPVPPLDDQQRLVSTIGQLEQVVTTVRDREERARQLWQEITEAVFTVV